MPLTRAQLHALVNEKFPDNNANLIAAAWAREFLHALIDAGIFQGEAVDIDMPALDQVLLEGNNTGPRNIIFPEGRGLQIKVGTKTVKALGPLGLAGDITVRFPASAGTLALLSDVKGSRWLNPVQGFVAQPTGAEANGTRYIVTIGEGPFAEQDTKEAELVAGTWVFTPTANGDAVKVVGINGIVYHKETDAWVPRSSGGSMTLAQVLATGRTTGGNSIEVTAGQALLFKTAAGKLATFKGPDVAENDRTLELPDADGVLATSEEVTAAITGATSPILDQLVVVMGALVALAEAFDTTLKRPEPFAPDGAYPTTYGGNPVQAGDSFRCLAGILYPNPDPALEVKTDNEDLLIANVDDPGQDPTNWSVFENNRTVVSQSGIEDMLTTDNSSIVSPVRFWQGFIRGLVSPEFRSAILGVPLTGYTAGANATIGASDSVLNAFRKLQAQTDNKSNVGHTHLMSSITNAGALATLNELPTISIILIQAGHPFNNGDIVYRTGFGNWALAMSVNSLAAHGYLYVQARLDANRFLAVAIGRVTKDAGDLATGVAFYLSDTVAGKLTSTPPTAAGTYVVRLLMAQSGSEGYFFPSAPVPTTIANLAGTSQLGTSLLQETTPQGMKARLAAFLSRSVSYTGSTILTVSNGGNAVNVTTGAPNATLLLPDLTAEPEAGDGWLILVRKVDNGVGSVLTNPATMSLTKQGSSMLVARSAGSWVAIPLDRYTEFSSFIQTFLGATDAAAAMKAVVNEQRADLVGAPFTTASTTFVDVTSVPAVAGGKYRVDIMARVQHPSTASTWFPAIGTPAGGKVTGRAFRTQSTTGTQNAWSINGPSNGGPGLPNVNEANTDYVTEMVALVETPNAGNITFQIRTTNAAHSPSVNLVSMKVTQLN